MVWERERRVYRRGAEVAEGRGGTRSWGWWIFKMVEPPSRQGREGWRSWVVGSFLVKRNAESGEVAEEGAENLVGIGEEEPWQGCPGNGLRRDATATGTRSRGTPQPRWRTMKAKCGFPWVDGMAVLGLFFRDSLACAPGGSAPPGKEGWLAVWETAFTPCSWGFGESPPQKKS